MSDKPWDFWTPGVLSKSQMIVFCKEGYITNIANFNKSIDYSSLDLHLSEEGYLMTKGSAKPSGKNYLKKILKHKLAKKINPINNVFTLEPKSTYLFKLQELLNKTNELEKAKFYGMATAKSSVGRVDVLARLIVDGMDKYEYFDPNGLKHGNGELFLEITPMTFPVIVKKGISLSQVRIFYGDPEISEIKNKLVFKSLLLKDANDDGSLSVDLEGVNIGKVKTSAFCTYESNCYDEKKPIKLWKPHKNAKNPNPVDYWKRIKKDKYNRITIEKDVFYILKSKEKISVPGGIAIYCRAIDETIGEMRIHYAGFAHPFFGTENKKRIGTPLIFEVRGHNVRVSLKHGEKMAHLVCYRLSEDNNIPSNTKKKKKNVDGYNYQNLELSKFFLKWSDK